MLLTPGKMKIPKDTILFQEGEAMEHIVIVLSGKVWLQNKSYHMIKGPATCIGLIELPKRVYTSIYKVIEDADIFVLPLMEREPVHALIEKNLDYRAIMVSSQFKHVSEVCRIHNVLVSLADKLYHYVVEAYQNYLGFFVGTAIQPLPVHALEQLEVYEDSVEFDEAELHFYAEAAKIPMSAQKAYFAYSEDMAISQIDRINEKLQYLIDDCVHILEYIGKIVEALVTQKNANLYDCSLILAKDLRREGLPYEQWTQYMLAFLNEGNQLAQAIAKNTGIVLPYDISMMREQVLELSSREMTAEEMAEKEAEDARLQRNLLSLQNSMDQIIAFSEIEESELEAFREGMEYFIKASDKFSVDDDMKNHKRKITDGFFRLFKACYWKRTEIGVIPTPVQMFLDYGFVDERLLTEEHLNALCADRGMEILSKPCRVYKMCEWLDAIYMGRKQPSKNEFDEDFKEYIHSLSKQGDLEVEESVAIRDVHWKVEFEIDNMFRVNDRICYGQPSTYVPVLFSEAMYGSVDKMIVTGKRVNDCIEYLSSIDYSVFYRETIYSNLDVNIYNFMIPTKVYPDIILVPVYGTNASMWQEISEKDKRSPGRFVFPSILGVEMQDAMLKMFGRFHWELCRCIMGMEWNDIRAKSLTSEYMDYIQFYRKNRDLSEEARQKMKLQIQKARNNSREFFLIDYENYMKNEMNGSMKVNKVSRELLGTYVPFKKEIREKLKVQKAYEVAFARHERDATKHVQEIESVIRLFQKQRLDVPGEIMDAYSYYLDN